MLVDPGHGGKDPGAAWQEGEGGVGGGAVARIVSGGAGIVREADINLAVGLVLGELLSRRGYRVLMIRTRADEAVSLRERCRRANEAGAQCFVSVHCNSVAGPGAGRACGVETWCREGSAEGRRLAGLVQGRLAAVTGARDRGVKTSRELAVLNGARMPAALVECGFISNAAERMLLLTPGYRQAVAGAVAEGVDEFLRTIKVKEGQDA